ncbi:hypothetical protein G6F65_019635 [Rhizopus arrhizus]|nr:hypothetical protein G6F65_019635 [Rhizopus arrhizus]
MKPGGEAGGHPDRQQRFQSQQQPQHRKELHVARAHPAHGARRTELASDQQRYSQRARGKQPGVGHPAGVQIADRDPQAHADGQQSQQCHRTLRRPILGCPWKLPDLASGSFTITGIWIGPYPPRLLRRRGGVLGDVRQVREQRCEKRAIHIQAR